MTQIKEKLGIRKSVVIATVVAIQAVVKNGFHCTGIISDITYWRIQHIRPNTST